MANTKTRSARITYGQLNKVLSTLGFVRKRTSEFVAYKNLNYDAMFVLPIMRSDRIVGDPYLVTVRNTVVGNGIASELQLQSLFVAVTAQHKVLANEQNRPQSPVWKMTSQYFNGRPSTASTLSVTGGIFKSRDFLPNICVNSNDVQIPHERKPLHA